MRNAALLALVTLVVVIAFACGDDGDDPSPSATSTVPLAATATAGPDVSSVFPVVLEHETLVVASADGLDITETPLEPGEWPFFGRAGGSPDGRYTALFRDGRLLIQEGDGEPAPIPDIPSASNYQYGAWSPDSSRMLFSVWSDETQMDVYVINADGSGLTALSEGLSGTTFYPLWSPDGAQVAFSLWPPEASVAQMYVTRSDGTERTLLGEYFSPQGDQGWDTPAWSRDGERIAAVTGGLRVFDIAGGTVRDVAEGGVNRFSWSPDGRFLALDTRNEGASAKVLMIVDITASAEPRLLVEGSFPRWSPDGERIAFKQGGVYTIRPDGTDEVDLAAGGPGHFGDLTWSEDSRDVKWVREASREQHLYAIDVRDGTVVRTPSSLTDAGYQGYGAGDIDLGPNAEQVAFQVSAGKEGQNTAGWFTMDVDTGELTKVADDPRPADYAAGEDVYWSAEGIRIAYSVPAGVNVTDDGTSPPPRLVSRRETLGPLAWSPDGRSLAFLPFPEGADIHIVDVETTDEVIIAAGLSDDSDSLSALEWSPDGTALLYVVRHHDGATGESTSETFVARLDGSPPVTWLAAEVMGAEATWSPDGDAIAYALGDDATTELWLMNHEGGEQRRVAGFDSPNYGTGQLHWSPDGGSIAVVAGSGDVYVVDVETGSSQFVATNAYDLHWSPDGGSIAVVGGSDVYVVDSESGSSLLVATNPGYCQVNLLGWSPDSQRLFAVPFCEFTI